MPPKKRLTSSPLPPGKRTAPSEEAVFVVTVITADSPCVETFVVPLILLGKDRADVEEMIEFGLTPDESVFLDDPEPAPAPGFATIVRRLGLRLGLLVPSDDPEREEERTLSGTLAKTKLKGRSSYYGPSIGVLGMQVF